MGEISIPKEEVVDISSLTTDGNNPNIMSDRERKALKQSMQKYGFVLPIITNKDLLIADGQQRYEVAKELGLKEVKVVRLPLKEVDRRILRQVLNKLRGSHDRRLDFEEYKKIYDDAGDFGDVEKLLPGENFKKILREITVGTRRDNFNVEEELNAPAMCKKGELWCLGEHLVYCQDAKHTQRLFKEMSFGKVDMVFTDPPYAIYGSSTGVGSDVADDKMVRPFFESFFYLFKNVIKEFGHIYVCCDWRSYPSYWEINKEVGLKPKNLIVWKKNNFGLSGANYNPMHELLFFLSNTPSQKRMTVHRVGERKIKMGTPNVWEFPIVQGQKREHNAQKPVDLIAHALKHSTETGETVLDPFGGSGSTLIAAEKTGRKCFMVEIDPKYCDVIIKRWEQYTGKKAKNISEVSVSEDQTKQSTTDKT